jgi:hypothetical protein
MKNFLIFLAGALLGAIACYAAIETLLIREGI